MIPKFRAWNKNKQKMYAVDGFKESERKLYRCSLADDEFRKNRIETIHFVEDNLDDFILMQSTGLKDKHGIEVYLGDIVKCTRGCPHEVVFLQEYAGTYIGGMPAIYLSGLQEGYAWTGYEEIIGNIYEHKHLLEEE